MGANGVFVSKALMFLGSLFEERSFYLQLTDIKQKNSVKGVSIDFLILNLVDCITSLIFQVPYIYSDSVENLYKLRNPVHPEIRISLLLTLIDAIKLIWAIGLMTQVVKYKHARKWDQSFSTTLKSVLLVNLAVLIFTIRCIMDNNRYTLNYLDFLEIIWIINQFCKLTKMLPQLFMNFTNEYYPLHQHYAIMQMISFSLLSLGKVFSFASISWYSVPINFYTSPYIFVGFCYAIILFTQSIHYNPKKHAARDHQS